MNFKLLSLRVFFITAMTFLAFSNSMEAKRKKAFMHRTPPDLTKGGKRDDARDWRLGPIGANGWCFHKRTRHGGSSLARQVLITAVDKDGPAADKLMLDDVILGTNGKNFTYDARKALAKAINEAEKEKNKGRLPLKIWRPSAELRTGQGREMNVTLILPVMGTYSKTSPFNCPKTDKIIDNGIEHMKGMELKDNWLGHIDALGLLATGREDVMPKIKAFAHSLVKPGETLSVEKHVSMKCWHWSYKTVFLAEYYLATGDKHVLPTLTEYATKIAMGQSGAGTWGHTYAARENEGKLHGHLGGYGAINQQGLTCMIALKLADIAGIKHPEIQDAIVRGDNFFKYFIGKGTIPYGDHGAANAWFDDNGKSGSAAIFFTLMDNRKGGEFFCDMILGSTPNGREEGHTGHFWSHLWGGIGAANGGGPEGLQIFMEVMEPIFTLERQPNGRMAFQDNAGEAGKTLVDLKTKWDSTGSRLLQLCAPRKNIYITGKKMPANTHLKPDRVNQILKAGKLDGDVEARKKLTQEEILQLLQDPLPPIRALGARTLAERDINCVDKLIEMLDSDNRYARYGAAEALEKAGFGNQEAANKLIKLMESSDDVTFKCYAIAALINRDKKKGLLTAAKPAIPVLMKMAVEHSSDDPRRVLQHDIGRALFYNGRAQPRRGLLPEYGMEGVDRKLLIPAIKEILTNENGWARSTMSGFIYPKLTKAELNQLWGDIYTSTRHIAPSGIMFASGNRTHGLNIMAENKVKEGLDLAAWYIRYQKGHGSKARIPSALQSIIKYGPNAKKVVRELESHADWYEQKRNKRRKPDPKTDPAIVIRNAIKKIEEMPDAPKAELISIEKYIKEKPVSIKTAEPSVKTIPKEKKEEADPGEVSDF